MHAEATASAEQQQSPTAVEPHSPTVVHQGWLIKSPPQKRFPRAKWRRRYFLLRRSGAGAASPYVLEYFSDQSQRKLKGTIELDQCHQVDAGLTLDSPKHQYDFMFDIRTPKRTFYLAAETKSSMERWVDCICRVCGLKVYQRQTDGADGEQPAAAADEDAGSDAGSDSDSPPVSPASVSGPYIPISECISGPPAAAGATPEPSPTLGLPAGRAAVSAQPFSGRHHPRRAPARRATDAADLGSYDALRRSPAGPGPPPPLPQVNWETYPGGAQHTRSNSMPETVKGGVNKADQLCQGPPRPPKPPHLQEAGLQHRRHADEAGSDADSTTPRTPTTVPADEMYGGVSRCEAGRSAVGRRAAPACTGAAAAGAPGQIFNYDFSERPPPAVNRTVKPRKASESAPAEHSPAAASLTPTSASGPLTPTSAPGSAPPAVHRALKPVRPSAGHTKVLTLAPPPVRHGSGSARGSRAAPSPTPPLRPDGDAAEAPVASSPLLSSASVGRRYSDDVGAVGGGGGGEDGADGSLLHQLHYLDLDLAEAAESGSPSARTHTVYKTVDFVKTEAFNLTRQSVEQKRTGRTDT